MTFLNPALLFGLLAIGVPVAIHLLSKPKLKRIAWAATKLLTESLQRNRSTMQMEDLLLLLLRCLLVILLVLAFARPALLTAASGPGNSGAQTTAVLLVDVSASMGQSNGVQSRFDEAKTRIGDFLSHLAGHSTCALFLVSDSCKPVIAQPTDDFDSLQRTLDQTELSDRGTDLLLGIQAAIDLLKNSAGSHREIDVFTDSQSSAWRNLGKIRQLIDDNRNDIDFHVTVLGDHGEDNLAVSNIRVVGSVAAVNQPVICAVQVSNWGHAEVDNLVVKLAVDDGAPQDQKIINRIAPGASATINLVVHFDHPGYHSITASIPGDRLPADNQCSTALLVIDHLNALVVTDPASEDGARDGFFLTHALTPVSPEDLNAYYLKVKGAEPASLDHDTLADDGVVILSNVSKLNLLGAKNLANYVKEGGALLIFPGSAADPGFYNDDPVFHDLMPGRLGPSIDAPTSQKWIGWQGHDYQHPVTSLWNDPAEGNLGTIHAFHYFPLTLAEATPGASSFAVAKYANGEVAMAEREVGKGRVFLFTTPATTAWSSLPLDPAFVPLLLRTVSYAMSGQLGDLVLPVGHPFSYTIGSDFAGKDFFVDRPGHPKEHRPAGKVEAGDHVAYLRYSATDKAGVYRLYTEDDTQPKVAFAVQIEPSESNLQQQAATEIAGLTEEGKHDSAAPTAAQVPVPKVPGWEMGPLLALIALFVTLTELALAHWSSQSK